jgi:hypothetical protein
VALVFLHIIDLYAFFPTNLLSVYFIDSNIELSEVREGKFFLLLHYHGDKSQRDWF